MSRLIKKSHNVSILLYHIVCPIKYRRKVIDDEVEKAIKAICLDIEERYQIEFLEIGTDKDHVHFLVQSVPTYSPTKIVTTIKSLVAKHVFKRVPQSRSIFGKQVLDRWLLHWDSWSECNGISNSTIC